MATYQGTYSTPHTNGCVTMEVEAQSTSHAEQLIKAQTGCDTVWNIGYTQEYRDRGYRNNNSNSGNGYSSVSLGFFPTVILGGGAIFLLSIFGGNVEQSPSNNNQEKMTLEQQIQQRHDNIIRHSVHHVNDTIPEFFNTELQEDVIDDLGQDWDD